MNDPDNCGDCGVVCAEGRGTVCHNGACVCGLVTEGCGGTSLSTCCPPPAPGAMRYCANLQTDGNNCGGCGMQCDPLQANQCGNGQCVCGDSIHACAGTVDAVCCADVTGAASCVDARTSFDHCGTCDNACVFGETCRDGACSVGSATCPGGCGPGLVCCGGGCCTRTACGRGQCGDDAGTPVSDAGTPVSDAGTPVSDAGTDGGA